MLSISGGVNAVISSLNITGGLAEAGGAGISVGPGARVTLNRMLVTGNTAPINGGGIFNLGYLTQLNSTVSGNTAGGLGGGVLHSGPGPHDSLVPTLRVLNSTISGNRAGGDGGGVYVFRNAAQFRNTTITGNRAGTAGPGFGGGIVTQNNAETSTTLFNTIVAGNRRGSEFTTPDDFNGKNVEPGSLNNLIGDAATSGGLTEGVNANMVGNAGAGTIDIDAVLDAFLRDNGGPTPTHALRTGSPAIDRGDNLRAADFGGTTLLSDQRFEARVRDGNANGRATVDIGAFEVDRPVIANFGGDVTYVEGSPPVLLFGNATITDPDSPDFAIGRLIVRFSAGGQAEDRLIVRTLGNVSANANGNVLFAGEIIGTVAGGQGTTPLVVVFSALATPSKVQAVLRSVVYRSVSDNPLLNPRTVLAQVSDGDGGLSNAVSKTINVVGT